MILEQFTEEDGTPGLRLRYEGGALVCVLRGGLVPLIAMTYLNLKSYSDQRASDYVAGISNTLVHIAMTGTIPGIAGPL